MTNSPLREIVVSPNEYPFVGTIQYRSTLPLHEREVVLTFDDGPCPRYTPHILDALAANGEKATFFLIGATAQKYPALARRIYEEGHTVATHSQTHPQPFQALPIQMARAEIEDGVASIAAVLGEQRRIAPFFRFPGLGHSSSLDEYVKSRSRSIWSADVVCDDWTNIESSDVVDRALARLAAARKGVLLLHDIQRRTVFALPILLKELRRRGYRFVHAIQSNEVQQP